MYYDDNLPAGAANDPRAPYNEIDLVNFYEKEIDKALYEEMQQTDDIFARWLSDNDYLPTDGSVSEKTVELLIEVLAKDSKVQEAYWKFRADDLAEEFAEKAAEEQECRLEEYYARHEEY